MIRALSLESNLSLLSPFAVVFQKFNDINEKKKIPGAALLITCAVDCIRKNANTNLILVK